MSRTARDTSWHLAALVLVVSGLGLLAPLAWRQSHRAIEKSRTTLGGPPRAGHMREDAEPEIAPLRPLVADQIDLDPSVTETPALPPLPAPPAAAPPALAETPPEAREELRLSAANAKPIPPQTIHPSEIAPPVPALSQAALSHAESLGSEHHAVSPAWPAPQSLLDQLAALATAAPQTAGWTEEVKSTLERLSLAKSLSDPLSAEPLQSLQHLAQEGKRLALTLTDEQAKARLLRAGYAIVRRLAIWNAVYELARREDLALAPIVDRQAWTEALEEVDRILTASGATASWRKYLFIDRARDEFDSSICSPGQQRQLARDILHRMKSTQLSHDQEQFLRTPPFAALAEQLLARASETPDLKALVHAIEQHERQGRALHATALAEQYDLLRWSSDEGVCELAELVNAYYRNANVRVAGSAELINRFLPRQTSQWEVVEDVILGAWVSGQSQTATQLRIVLVPDERRWNIGLEAAGQVASNTSSEKGPARFYQDGWSFFRARKRLTVDRRGIRLFSAEAEANSNNSLSDFETDFDGIPLLGSLARSIARSQYDDSQPAAKIEVEGKIIVRATSQLDREVAKRLEQAKRDFQAKLVNPLRQLHLEPAAVDLETTAERLIARYRLAGRDHVSAHTPRPQAPGDSILSVQLHDSAFNNVLDKLNLAGRRVELRELYTEMVSRFTNEKAEIPADFPENVYVTFAEEDPVRLDFQDGLIRLTITLDELAQEGTRHRWTNFGVRAYYGPKADQLDANLERVGIVELISENRQLPIGQQVQLRAIFNKVLSRNRELRVINKQIAEAPELRDQQVTQFVINDGWLGIALGRKAPGRQAAMQPRPELAREAE